MNFCELRHVKRGRIFSDSSQLIATSSLDHFYPSPFPEVCEMDPVCLVVKYGHEKKKNNVNIAITKILL
jgi:hypothetical protein